MIFDKENNVTSFDSIKELQARMGQSIIDQRGVIDSLVLEDLPGLPKARAVKSMAENLAAGLIAIEEIGDTFTEDNGKLLSDCSYQSTAKLTAFTREQVNGLHRAVYLWIKKHQT